MQGDWNWGYSKSEERQSELTTEGTEKHRKFEKEKIQKGVKNRE